MSKSKYVCNICGAISTKNGIEAHVLKHEMKYGLDDDIHYC